MKKLFLDLDGTLANFDEIKNSLERFKIEKGFFLKLKPYKNINFIEHLKHFTEVYILSASPNVQADKDKIEWIKKYLPFIKEKNIILVRLGENKAEKIQEQLNITINKNCMLLDDYSKNLIEWEQKGGTGIKRLNGRNGQGIKFNKNKIRRMTQLLNYV